MKIIKINEYIQIVAYVSSEDLHQYFYNRMKHDVNFYNIKQLFNIRLSKSDSFTINNVDDIGNCYSTLSTNEFISLYGFDSKFLSLRDVQTQLIIPSMSFIERCKMPLRNEIGCSHTYSRESGGHFYYTNDKLNEKIEIALYRLTSEQRRKYNFRLIINYPYLNLVKRRKRYFKSLIKIKKNACKDQSSAERLFYRVLQYTRRFFKKN